MFGPLLEVAVSKKCTPLWQEAHFDETCENCRMFGPLFDDQIVLPCRKSARRCGAKHIWKSKPGPVKTKVTSAIISPFSWSNSVSLCVMVVPVDSICLCFLLPRLESCRQAIMHCQTTADFSIFFSFSFLPFGGNVLSFGVPGVQHIIQLQVSSVQFLFQHLFLFHMVLLIFFRNFSKSLPFC